MALLKMQRKNGAELTAGQIGLTPEGLGWAAVLAQHDVKMFCSDPDEEIVNGIADDVMPGEMTGLAKNVRLAVESGNLKLLGNSRRIFKDCRVIFVNSILPLGDDHLPKLRFIETIIRQASYQVPADTVMVIRTLLPESAVQYLQEQADAITSEREESLRITLCVMPDYRLAGDWLKQIANTHLLTVGCVKDIPEKLREILMQLPGAGRRIRCCTVGEAVLSGFGYNGLAAIRQTYMEELAQVCIKNGASSQKVRTLINALPGADPKTDNTGAGYGGTILSERVKTFTAFGELSGTTMPLCRQMSQIRSRHAAALGRRLKKEIRPKGKKLAVLGLAPFGDTDDLRDTPALEVIRTLLLGGAEIRLFMPCGINQAKWRFYKERENVTFCKTVSDAAEGADAVLIFGKWRNMHRLLTKTLPKRMRGNVVYDIVCGLNPDRVEGLGLKYKN